jgi:ABC-type phosphate/phosphonate transport system substrate-binding protein
LTEERATPWVEHLLAMDWDNPAHRPILEMEGLRRWVPPQLDGYRSLFEAVAAQGIGDRW